MAGIGEAKSLKELHLTSALLTGTIPDEVFSLSSLENLFLSNNGFTGPISSEFGQLKQLKNLYLLGNKLDGSIPPELGYLARLEHLSLGKNKLTGSIPRQITSLPLLEFLSLENESGSALGSGLSGPLPALDGFPRVSELYLQHNAFTGTVPDNFLQGVMIRTQRLLSIWDSIILMAQSLRNFPTSTTSTCCLQVTKSQAFRRNFATILVG